MNRISLLLFTLLFFTFSCKKGYLDIKPDQSLLVPTSLADMQRLLDNVIMSQGPALVSLASDEYEVTAATLAAFSTPGERNAYIWADDIYENQTPFDWEYSYKKIFYANVVLDGLKKINVSPENKAQWENIQATALFGRAFALFQLADQFTAPYIAATAGQSPGIPIKLNADVNERPGRGTLREVYTQIFKDLEDAVSKLPKKQQVYLSRPSQWACYALMARISLAISDYPKALFYANECLNISSQLLDYNTLNPTSTRPIAIDGVEVIFKQSTIDYSFGNSATLSINPTLVAMYADNDLRKVIFLRDRGNGIINFKGNYTGNKFIFSGLAIDEVYLIRAECKARANDVNGAMDDLNRLMINRWNNKVPYPIFNAANSNDALQMILNERRKELISRGTRWADLKRLNQDVRFATTIKRTFIDKEFILRPNASKYMFPIPQNEIDGSGIAQNVR